MVHISVGANKMDRIAYYSIAVDLFVTVARPGWGARYIRCYNAQMRVVTLHANAPGESRPTYKSVTVSIVSNKSPLCPHVRPCTRNLTPRQKICC